ncbi:flagellin [Gluconobacter morbifer]|uniref:Flagellar hook-associated protein FlgL n=1 Tax=Gluconobacter morbifer G707 TaxID=1088869 RepID=G6XK83_9PROT|nr:flagellin [Gluconobacter morbifer]EHH67679.1 flagellar hook-associated protein FlgL [Gluconobacter morbifer G707]
MTGTVSSFGFGGLSGQMLLGLQTLTKSQSSLQGQTSTGVTADSYAGLGSARTQALALQPAITRISSWSGNVTAAQNKLTSTQTALSQISDIASDLTSTLGVLSSTSSISTQSVVTASAQAKNALSTLTGLLNTQQGDTYVFAGQQSSVAPVSENLEGSDLYTQVENAVSQLGTKDASAVLSQATTCAANTKPDSPFSASLSTDPVSAANENQKIVMGQNETVSVGLVATQGEAASALSTGSPVRDLVRNLMMVASLGTTDTGSRDYTDIIQDLQTSTQNVTSSLADMSGVMGVQQDSLTTHSSLLSQMSSALTTQLGNTKDADLAQVSTQFTDTNNQLQASYSIIADMKSMTLASYL